MLADDALEEMIRDAMPGSIVTHYVMIAEVVGPDGPTISMATSDNMTPWLATGLLQYGLGMVEDDFFPFEDDEDE